MYAELVTMHLGPGMKATAEMVADQLSPVYKTLQGFKGLVFIGDIGAGEYGCLSLWELREYAEALSGSLKPRLKQLVQIAGANPKVGLGSHRIFEVYEACLRET